MLHHYNRGYIPPFKGRKSNIYFKINSHLSKKYFVCSLLLISKSRGKMDQGVGKIFLGGDIYFFRFFSAVDNAYF